VTIQQFQALLWAMVVLVGIVVVTGEPVTWRWILLIPALVLQSVFNVGLALGMARVGAKVVDMKHVIPFVLRTWMYGSCVLYSAQQVAGNLPGWLYEIFIANPMVVYIELVRVALMPDHVPAAPIGELWLLGVAWAAVIGVAGYIYFWRAETEYGRG
jgi:teichoic acid transport system permease protein